MFMLALLSAYLGLLLVLWIRPRSNSSHIPLPPGPTGALSLLGHVLVIPEKEPFRFYRDVSKELVKVLLDGRSSQSISGEDWRIHRRLFDREFRPAAALRFHPIIIKSLWGLLHTVVAKPNRASVMHDLRNMIASIVLSIAYGLSSTSMPVKDFKPLLRWYRESFDAVERPYQAGLAILVSILTTEQKAGSNRVPESFLSSCMGEQIPEDVVKSVAASMYSGMEKAFIELDALLGRKRLPTFADQDSLPYITAIVKESLRTHPVTPLAIPHFTTSEDVYQNYRIPANAILVANLWAILHDPDTYPDPESFDPERFLKNGQLNTDIPGSESIAFGFGRRQGQIPTCSS
ncbi:cytochrome P450 [Mycena floridula]|nr:cytochrome P450 [Mycena floridula]